MKNLAKNLLIIGLTVFFSPALSEKNKKTPAPKMAVFGIEIHSKTTSIGDQPESISGGTAFVADGKLLTATHVIKAALRKPEMVKHIVLYPPNNWPLYDEQPSKFVKKIMAKNLYLSPEEIVFETFESDVTQVHLKDSSKLSEFLATNKMKEFSIAKELPGRDEKVMVFGINQFKIITLRAPSLWQSTGKKKRLLKTSKAVTNKYPETAGKMIRTSRVKAFPGNSGGPLVLASDPTQVIGVTSHGNLFFFLPQNLSYFGSLVPFPRAHKTLLKQAAEQILEQLKEDQPTPEEVEAA